MRRCTWPRLPARIASIAAALRPAARPSARRPARDVGAHQPLQPGAYRLGLDVPPAARGTVPLVGHLPRLVVGHRAPFGQVCHPNKALHEPSVITDTAQLHQQRIEALDANVAAAHTVEQKLQELAAAQSVVGEAWTAAERAGWTKSELKSLGLIVPPGQRGGRPRSGNVKRAPRRTPSSPSTVTTAPPQAS